MKTEKESQSTENWRGSEPLIPESSIVQTVETELVVVGGGLAGVAAIRQAASMGTKVVLFEKCKSPQARSGDFATAKLRIYGDGGGLIKMRSLPT